MPLIFLFLFFVYYTKAHKNGILYIIPDTEHHGKSYNIPNHR